MNQIQWPSTERLSRLSDHQSSVLPAALQSRVGILCGQPGTGKTFVAAELIAEVVRIHGAHHVAVAAPTGKAAVRMTEMLSEIGIPIQATTIHRLLEVGRNGHDGKGWGFIRNEHNPLDQTFFFIDEPSMLDTDTASALFRAFPDQAHVLLVGDPNQLPPVGHGAPLRDMIASGCVGVAELTEIRRNSGEIVRGCQRIKNGISFRPPTEIDPSEGKNWLHIETSSTDQQVSKMESILLGAPDGIDPVFDCQVICSLNEKSPVSRSKLNERLQSVLNINTPDKNQTFAMDDKVICTSNSYLELAARNTPGVVEGSGLNEMVANGETGKVVAISSGKIAIELFYPNRVVVLPAAGKGSASRVFDLGYAITCHKSQGSQMPVVIAMIDESAGASRVTCREWWYTCLSRAERYLITIGRWDVLMKQCIPISLMKRKTFMKERIQKVTA